MPLQPCSTTTAGSGPARLDWPPSIPDKPASAAPDTPATLSAPLQEVGIFDQGPGAAGCSAERRSKPDRKQKYPGGARYWPRRETGLNPRDRAISSTGEVDFRDNQDGP